MYDEGAGAAATKTDRPELTNAEMSDGCRERDDLVEVGHKRNKPSYAYSPSEMSDTDASPAVRILVA